MSINNLCQPQVPRHVAIVMDGNGRWAQQRFLPRMVGHNKGVDAVRKIVKFCLNNSIEALTLFAFSSENWKRGPQEVSMLLALLQKVITDEVAELHANNVKLSIIGDTQKLSPALQQIIQRSQKLTQNNTKLKLNIAINYGGRWDIMQATQAIAQDVASGKLTAAAINEQVVGSYMALHAMPEVDLFIRTSGEQRISNFLLWQLAYTEIYFTDTLWPDFDDMAMTAAVAWFNKRERKFGYESAINYKNDQNSAIKTDNVSAKGINA